MSVEFCPVFLENDEFESLSGLAIYAARRLRSRTAKITAVIFTACGGWHFFRNMRCRIGHLPGGFKCEFSPHGIIKKSPKPGGQRGVEEEREHADTQIARVERRRLCYSAFYAAIPKGKPFAEKRRWGDLRVIDSP